MFTDEELKSWRCRDATVHYVCLIHTPEELYEADESVLSSMLQRVSFCMPWRVYKVRHMQDWYVSLYRKRLILSYRMPRQDYIETDIIIRQFLNEQSSVVAFLAELQQKLGVRKIIHYPVIDVKRFRLQGVPRKTVCGLEEQYDLLPWLDDRVTTFSLRIFNMFKGDVSYVRLSRHVMMCYGLRKATFQEIINLVHERFLYKLFEEDSLDAADVFSLIDGLAAYTMPIELNLFLYEIVAKIAIFVATIGALLTVLLRITEDLTWWQVALAYLGWGIASAVTYILIRRVRIYRHG